MAVLLDTSVLGRLANRTDASHSITKAAVAELHRRSEKLYVAPQSFVEFRNFTTRPVAANGLGLTVAEAESLAATFESAFSLLDESPGIYPAWKALVNTLGIIGKQVHDARLVAVCHVHSVTHLLTFNVSHFVRMAGVAPGIVVIDAATV